MTVTGAPSGGVEAAKIVVFNAGRGIASPRRYGTYTALATWARGIGCQALVHTVAGGLLAADEVVALELAGWRVDRVDRFRVDGVAVHAVWALQGEKRIVYVRRGAAPQVNPSVYRAGQTLEFPRSGKLCTSAFVLRLSADGSLVGLSAGHCSGFPVIQPGVSATEDATHIAGSGVTPLGSVLKNTYPNGDGPGPDALVFGLQGAGIASQQIDRGRHPPRQVVGVLPLGRQRKGREVCFSGYTSGIDQCGRIHGRSTFLGTPVLCARGVRSRHGDSGAAVYTRPDRRGRVRAVGVLARSSIGGMARDMCYTPIQTILGVYGAELPIGSFQVPPTPPVIR